MYEVGSQVRIHAFHVMPGMPPPEGERHSHDYRVEARVSRDELDDHGMVVDLDVLNSALQALADRLTDRDLEQFVADVDAVTVEAFARWLHGDVSQALGPLPGALLAIRVWETPEAYGGYSNAISGFPATPGLRPGH